MRENTNALGFIPSSTIETQYIQQGRYIIQRNRRGDKVGYVLYGSPIAGRILTIAQAVIEVDRRDLGFGYLEILHLIEIARTRQCREIKLRCAEDLQANEFWSSIGFVCVNKLEIENTRKRCINVFMLPLQPRLF